MQPVVGDDLLLSPHHRLTATATYTLPLGESIGRIAVGATYTYTSRQIGTNSSPYRVLPTSNQVNLNLNWDGVAGMPIDLAAFVTNVTKDKSYLTVAGNWSIMVTNPR